MNRIEKFLLYLNIERIWIEQICSFKKQSTLKYYNVFFRNAELPEEASKKDDSDHKDNEELITMDTKVSTTDIKMLFHTKLNNLESCVEVNNY